jgi:hypothetical protein
MAALYEVCHSVHGDAHIKKDAIYSTVHEAMQDTEESPGIEDLDWFGPLRDHEKRTRTGSVWDCNSRNTITGS